MSLKSAAVRYGLATVAAGSALALTACGAGQISQTANQVPAVDGASANSEDGFITLRDVTVYPKSDDSNGAVKFALANSNPNGEADSINSVKVDGQDVSLSGDKEIKAHCQALADGSAQIKEMSAHKGDSSSSSASASASASATAEASEGSSSNCHDYITTSFSGTPTAGSSVEVTFTFDKAGEIKVSAPVAAPTPKSGNTTRDEEGKEHSK